MRWKYLTVDLLKTIVGTIGELYMRRWMVSTYEVEICSPLSSKRTQKIKYVSRGKLFNKIILAFIK